jgi:2'-5' RNA ligase
MADRNFSNTYWVSIALPQILPSISQWVKENLDEKKDIVSSEFFKNPVQNDPHISVLLGLPSAPDEGLVKLIQEFKSFNLSFGPISSFPLETKTVGSTSVKYQVLHVEVAENKSLVALQQAIGNYFSTKVEWHHPKYNPHITIAFVNEGVAEKFSVMETVIIDKKIAVEKVTIKKFGDKSFTPLQISLA